MKKLLIAVALLFASSTSAQYPTTSFTAGGNITAASASCLATNCVPIKLPASATTLTVGVTGTFSATLAVEESQDGGRTWTSAGSNITGAGTTSFTITAFSDFRVRASAYVSGNAGINILVSASTNSGGGGVSALNTLTGAVVLVAGTNITLTPSGNNITVASSGAPSVNHALGWAFGDLVTGAPLTTSEVGYVRVPYSCTLQDWYISVDAGTVTIKVARVNGGTANPTLISNSISTSGISLSSGTQTAPGQSLADFTSTAIVANDSFGFFITTVATAKQVTVQLVCQ